MASYNDIRKQQAMNQVQAEALQAGQENEMARQAQQAQQQEQMKQMANAQAEQQFNQALSQVYAPNVALEALKRNAITEEALRNEAMQRQVPSDTLSKYANARQAQGSISPEAENIANQILSQSMPQTAKSPDMSALEAFAAARNRAQR
jgi:hypothetical protein